MSERNVAELMWTNKPCCNVEDGNGRCSDDCKVWTSPDGKHREYGASLNVQVTADEMLEWLWGHTCPDCLTVSTECYQVHGPLVVVDCCSLPGGEEWPKIEAPTLHAALEAAVRAVAGVGE